MRGLLAFLLTLTMICPVFAESNCLHEDVYEIISNEVRPQEAGHISCKVITSICQECKRKFVDEQFGGFRGHIFHMAESIHCEADGMHLWVFLCSGCMYITMMEDACTGGDQCMTYSAQVGEIPAVQYADSLAAWKETNEKNDIVARWIANDYNSIWIAQNRSR